MPQARLTFTPFAFYGKHMGKVVLIMIDGFDKGAVTVKESTLTHQWIARRVVRHTRSSPAVLLQRLRSIDSDVSVFYFVHDLFTPNSASFTAALSGADFLGSDLSLPQ